MANSLQQSSQTADVYTAIFRLLSACDALDRGCLHDGFRGLQNGLGEEVGGEIQEARNNLAALVGHVSPGKAAQDLVWNQGYTSGKSGQQCPYKYGTWKYASWMAGKVESSKSAR